MLWELKTINNRMFVGVENNEPKKHVHKHPNKCGNPTGTISKYTNIQSTQSLEFLPINEHSCVQLRYTKTLSISNSKLKIRFEVNIPSVNNRKTENAGASVCFRKL